MCSDNQTYIEPSNYLFRYFLFCFLLYVMYAIATMYVYVYVYTWVYGLLDFERKKLFKLLIH